MDSIITVSEVFDSEVVTLLEEDSVVTTEVLVDSDITEEVTYNSVII